MSDCKVISIINWKGGVGKTTIAHHLATGLQNLSLNDVKKYLGSDNYPRVLLVDTDPQCNLSISCLGYSKFEKMVYSDNEGTMKELIRAYLDDNKENVQLDKFILKRSVNSSRGKIYIYVDLILSHSDLIYIDMEIAKHHKTNSQGHSLIYNNNDLYKFQLIHKIFEGIKNKYDFIFIDCPPNLNYITQNALYESDYYIIPAIPDRLSSYGIISITNKVKDLNQEFKSLNKSYTNTELLGIILNNVREYRNSPKISQTYIIDTIKEKFPNEVFKNHLTYGDGIVRASSLGYPVFSLSGRYINATKQSEQIVKIVTELIKKISEEENEG